MPTLLAHGLPASLQPSERTRVDLVRRLLGMSPLPEISHGIAAATVGGMLWGPVPPHWLVGWMTAIAGLSVGRLALRRWYAQRLAAPRRVPAPLIVLMVAIGLAWGGPGALLIRASADLPMGVMSFEARELVIIVACGLTAAGTSALAASVVAYQGFLLAFFAPVFVTFIAGGQQVADGEAALLVTIFGGIMTGLHLGNHLSLRRSIELSHGLADSNVALERQRVAAEHAQVAVQENERRWFQLLESMPAGVVVVRPSGELYYANGTAREFVGPSSATADGMRYPVFPCGSDTPVPHDELPAITAARSGQRAMGEYLIRAPGQTRIVESLASPIRGSDGRVAFGMAILTDVTSRHAAEHRRGTLNVVFEALTRARDESDIVAQIPPALGRHLGCDVVEMWLVDRPTSTMRRAGVWTSASMEAPAAEPFPLGAGLPGRAWTSASTVQSWQASQGDSPALRAAGLQTAVTFPLLADGAVHGAITVASRDVRECDPSITDALLAIGAHIGAGIDRRRADAALREADERYRHLVDSSRDMIWQIGLDGRWTFVSNGSRNLLGRSPQDLVGHYFAEHSDPAHAAADRSAFRRIAAGETIAEYETVRRDVHGIPRTVATSAAPLHDASGRIVGFHGTARDVTEAVAIREALRAARDAAEQATAAKSAFLANMSHEIRTPLNGILGMSELLLDMSLDAEQQRAVELIVSSGRSLLRVINDILDYSKIEASQMEIESTGFDLHELVNSTVKLISSGMADGPVEVVADIAEDVPAHVTGDPTRLRQVLGNLLGNAAKFTAAGEVVVTVTREEHLIRFGVRDTGMGMDAASVARIGEPFRQADATTTRRFGGTGLGLSISKRLVELMGGTLGVRSAVGEGTEFSFQLRLPAGAAPSVRDRTLAGARLLVVDDNATNPRVMRGMLEAAGARVTANAEPTLATSLLRGAAASDPYDALVCDVQMPGLDGFGVVEALRRDPAIGHLPVVLASSGGRTGDLARARAMGVSTSLLKPLARRELVEAVATAVRQAPTPAEAPEAARAIGTALARLRILLAEDNPINQQVAASMLRRRGHDVEVVDNGRDAVGAASREHFDAVLMDIQMPVMDGLAATAEIRRLCPDDVPIIALTANALSGERERCLAAGMDDYLAKPFIAQDLFAVVERQGPRPARDVAAPTAKAAAALDLTRLRQDLATAGIEEVLPALFELFLADGPARLEAFQQAASAGDASAMATAAHAFKSPCAALHAERLASVLAQAERTARSGDAAAAAALAPEIAAAHADARALVLAYREDPSTPVRAA